MDVEGFRRVARQKLLSRVPQPYGPNYAAGKSLRFAFRRCFFFTQVAAEMSMKKFTKTDRVT